MAMHCMCRVNKSKEKPEGTTTLPPYSSIRWNQLLGGFFSSGDAGFHRFLWPSVPIVACSSACLFVVVCGFFFLLITSPMLSLFCSRPYCHITGNKGDVPQIATCISFVYFFWCVVMFLPLVVVDVE